MVSIFSVMKTYLYILYMIFIYVCVYIYIYISISVCFCHKLDKHLKIGRSLLKAERWEYKRVLISYMQPIKHILKYFHLHIFTNRVEFLIFLHLGFNFFPFILYLTRIKSHCTFLIHTLMHTQVYICQNIILCKFI